MKRRTKFGLFAAALLFVGITTTSCTANFCSTQEQARMLYASEPGACKFITYQEKCTTYSDPTKYYTQQVENNPNLYAVCEKSNTFSTSSQLSTVITTVSGKYGNIPTSEYFATFDIELLKKAITQHNAVYTTALYDINTISAEEAYIKDPVSTVGKSVLDEFGYLKFWSSDTNLYDNYYQLNAVVRLKIGDEKCPTRDFESAYVSAMNTIISTYKSCMTLTSGEYGTYGDQNKSITLTGKSWSDAWSKGPIEGLLVFPVAWMIDSFAGAFGFYTNSASGVPQMLALLVVTVIVRLFLFLCTFKPTMSQQKMTALQPELQKIQAKYPNSNTNKAEKQRLAQEQMALYKKHKINPLTQIIVLIIQFPVFIGVWGAMSGSAIISTGAVLNLKMSQSISTALFNISSLPSNDTGWWTALVLFILMAASQFVSMKLPTWIQKARSKNVTKLSKNPAQDSTNKTMNMVSWVMVIMIIIMGFTLPAAMGLYWLIGALVQIAQTLIMQFVVNKPKDKNKRR